MASGGPDQNASQFYITTRDNIDYLDGQHTVFGEVVEGLDVLSKINSSIVDDNFRPLLDIRIKHTNVLFDPYDDPPGLVIPDASPLLTRPVDEVRVLCSAR